MAGAPGHSYDAGPGAAYIFLQSGTTWSEQGELTASDGLAYDYFGWSVALDGSTAVVGAPYHMVGSNGDQGAAYVFVESGTTWSQQTELIASDGASADELGASVALTNNTLVAGAPGRTVGSSIHQGAAYVFSQSGATWSQQAELTSSDGEPNDQFGFSVALNGSTIVSGAPSHIFGTSSQGAAYVFAQSGADWNQEAELIAPDGASYDEFGFSVGASGTTAVLGAYAHEVGSNAEQGTAYVFVNSVASGGCNGRACRVP
jgi:hypothetical protein